MILILNASPRKTGITTTLLKIMAEEARTALEKLAGL
jgi:multimeric flavodoxin WrbA